MIRIFSSGFLLFFATLGCLGITSCGDADSSQQQEDVMPVESQNPASAEQPAAPEQVDLNALLLDPVPLTGVETRVDLSEVLPGLTHVDSLDVWPGLEATWEVQENSIRIRVIGDIGFLSVMTIWSEGRSVQLLLERKDVRRATLRLRDQGYQRVAVRGRMTDWDPEAGAMELRNGIWEKTFELSPGDYPYQFIADGKTLSDPKNPVQQTRTQDGATTVVSVLQLKDPGQGKAPQIAVEARSANPLTVRLDGGGALIAFWQNQQIPVERNGRQFLVSLPEEASTVPVSVIRLWAQNEFGVATEQRIEWKGNETKAE